jgi:hypothetical protein
LRCDTIPLPSCSLGGLEQQRGQPREARLAVEPPAGKRRGPGELRLDHPLAVPIDEAGLALGRRVPQPARETPRLAVKDFAALVQRSIRTEDTMGCYGGEEFLVICRSDVRGAINTEAVLFLSEPDQVRRTVSISVPGFDPGRQSVEELIARADQAMYRAKSRGRNCVCACADERS